MTLTDDLAELIARAFEADFSDEHGAMSEEGTKRVARVAAEAVAECLELALEYGEGPEDRRPLYRINLPEKP